MLIEYLYSKIHRATVTDANLDYVGSITIDKELMDLAKLKVGQKVDILNVTNGERFQTYIIKGEKGKRDICLNGAAAHKASVGDKIIIVSYAHMSEREYKAFKPTVVIVDEHNNPVKSPALSKTH